MTDQRYTFSSQDNSYFNGRDVRVTNNETGDSILVNLKDNLWAVCVKDRQTFNNYPADLKTAAEKIGEPETQVCYERAQEGYWTWASMDLAGRHGFTICAAGRSGGWLAVEDTRYWDPQTLIEPGTEDRSGRRHFLELAFEAVATIDVYRSEFYEMVKEEAEDPAGNDEPPDRNRNPFVIESEFLRGYLECAIWSSSDPDSEEPLDSTYTIDDIDADWLKVAEEDCAVFGRNFAFKLQEFGELTGCEDSHLGHDFWLTRNGHGTGYWDRYMDASAEADDREKAETVGRLLSDGCKQFGEKCLMPISGGKLGE